MKKIITQLQQVKNVSYKLARLSAQEKTQILLSLAVCLQKHKGEILVANNEDVRRAKKNGATAAFLDRLTLSQKTFEGMITQLKTVAKIADPVGEILEQLELANGINLRKMRFPLGVILMIYESRPNVTIDAASLCLRSGNVAVLKGGSEAYNTNKALVACIRSVMRQYNVDESAVTFLEKVTHADVEEILQRNDLIDMVIPRGSYTLTSAVAEKSRIPILYHSSGGARMYIDESANLKKALEICINAKTNRTGVCNALDMVLIHTNVAKKILPLLDKALEEKGFQIRADKKAKKYMVHAINATNKDFETEFLDSILAVRIVESADEAIAFIKTHTHGHTEVLAAEDKRVVSRFISEIDAAGLMINCSSRLHDGGEFGLGAEMGIATGKFHARGPVGARELTTYKWIAYGNGQIKH